MNFFLDENYYYDAKYKIDYNALIYDNQHNSFKKLNLDEIPNAFGILSLNKVNVYRQIAEINSDGTNLVLIYILIGDDANKYCYKPDDQTEIYEKIISNKCKKIIVGLKPQLNNVLNTKK